MSDPAPQSFALAVQRKLERFYAGIQPVGITILINTACLEFYKHRSEPLKKPTTPAADRKTHEEIYTYLGDRSPE